MKNIFKLGNRESKKEMEAKAIEAKKAQAKKNVEAFRRNLEIGKKNLEEQMKARKEELEARAVVIKTDKKEVEQIKPVVNNIKVAEIKQERNKIGEELSKYNAKLKKIENAKELTNVMSEIQKMMKTYRVIYKRDVIDVELLNIYAMIFKAYELGDITEELTPQYKKKIKNIIDKKIVDQVAKETLEATGSVTVEEATNRINEMKKEVIKARASR